MHRYRRKALFILLFLLVLFFLIGVYSYVQILRKDPILHIGLSYYEENMIILVLSILSMVKVVYEIYQVEHPKEYEEKMRAMIMRKNKH